MQNALQAEQANRYANAMRDVNNQIDQVQRELATSTDKAISSAAEKSDHPAGTSARHLQYDAPADRQSGTRADCASTRQLSLVEGPVNAFVSGLTRRSAGHHRWNDERRGSLRQHAEGHGGRR